jgi:hypothetical protein
MLRSGRPTILLFLAGAFLVGAAGTAGPPGRKPAAPSKSLILAGWHGEPTPTPDFIQASFAFLETQPFNGMIVYLRDPAFAVNATTGIMTNTPVTHASIASILDPLKGLPFTQMRENFGHVIGNSPPDFFDDWSVPIQNFANLARALKEAGLKGFFFDNEQYFSPWGAYPAGVAYPDIPLSEYEAQASLRGRQVMEAMAAEFPEIVVLTLHGPYISESRAVRQMGHSMDTSFYALLGPFFVGLLQGAGSLAQVVDGGELYWLRTAADFRGSYGLRKYGLASDLIDCSFIPPDLRPDWPGLSSISFGILDRPFLGEDMDPAILTTTLSNAIARADRWVWLYTEGRTFLKPESDGGASQAWIESVRAALPVDGPGPAPAPGNNEESQSSCGLLGLEVFLVILAARLIRSRF